VNILSTVSFPDRKTATAAAKALVASSYSVAGFSQPMLSSSFIVALLKSRKFSASELEALVARKLSTSALNAFLQVKDKRVGVTSVFLQHNMLSEEQVEQFLKFATPAMKYRLLLFQGDRLSYSHFKNACQASSKNAGFLTGFINYADEFVYEDLSIHLKTVLDENKLEFMERQNFVEDFFNAAKAVVVQHPGFLSELETFAFREDAGLDVSEGYLQAMASASFRSEEEFHHHFRNALKLLKGASYSVKQRLLRSLMCVSLNPRVSTVQAHEVLRFVESINSDAYMLDHIRSKRNQAFSEGFDVFYGSYAMCPSHLVEGLMTLCYAQKQYGFSEISPYARLVCLQTPDIYNRHANYLTASFFGLHRITAKHVLSLIDDSHVFAAQKVTFWYSQYPVLPVSKPVKTQIEPWVSFACEKLGTDVAAWQTFITLANSHFQNSSDPVVYTDLVRAACKLSYA